MNAPADTRRVMVAIAKRVAAYPKPSRPAIGLPVNDTVAMARLTVALDRIAELAADMLAARGRDTGFESLEEAEAASAAETLTLVALAEALAAHGYVNFQEEPEHGNAA